MNHCWKTMRITKPWSLKTKIMSQSFSPKIWLPKGRKEKPLTKWGSKTLAMPCKVISSLWLLLSARETSRRTTRTWTCWRKVFMKVLVRCIIWASWSKRWSRWLPRKIKSLLLRLEKMKVKRKVLQLGSKLWHSSFR